MLVVSREHHGTILAHRHIPWRKKKKQINTHLDTLQRLRNTTCTFGLPTRMSSLKWYGCSDAHLVRSVVGSLRGCSWSGTYLCASGSCHFFCCDLNCDLTSKIVFAVLSFHAETEVENILLNETTITYGVMCVRCGYFFLFVLLSCSRLQCFVQSKKK